MVEGPARLARAQTLVERRASRGAWAAMGGLPARLRGLCTPGGAVLALTGEPGAATAAGGMVGHRASGAGGACAPRYWCIRPAVAAATARPLAVPPIPSPHLANTPAAHTGAWLFPSPRPASPHCVSYSPRQGLVFVLSSSPALPTSLRLSRPVHAAVWLLPLAFDRDFQGRPTS